MISESASAEMRGLDWLKGQSKDARPWQVKIFACRFGQLAAQVTAFWLFSSLMQDLVVAKRALPLEQFTPFVGAVTVWALCIWAADTLSYRAKFSLEKTLENQLHQHLQSRQIALTRQHSSTYWQQLFLTHLNDVGDYLTQYSVQKWISGVAPLVVLLVILPVNYLVAITLLLTLPVVPLFMILIGKGTAALHRKHFIALERLGDLFSDRLKGLSLITATGQHPHQLARLEKASKVVNRKTMKVVSLAFLNNTVLDFFATVSIALVAVFIGFSMLGELNIGPSINLHQGLFMLLVAPLLFAELRSLGKLYHQKAKAEAGAERFEAVFREALFREPGYDAKPEQATTRQSGDVAWINFQVSAPRLHADQLSLRRGDWIRLRGQSGSGKTALLEALMGFRPASHALLGELALLSQQSCILDDSLAFNLHLGQDGFSEEQLIHALSEVDLEDWFQALPDGLQSPMGDCPAMSGGEAQRLALARVLLLKKDTVLLDEPTAHLTDEQHRQLSKLIRDKLANKTVIWASHKTLPEGWFNQDWQINQGEISVRSQA